MILLFWIFIGVFELFKILILVILVKIIFLVRVVDVKILSDLNIFMRIWNNGVIEWSLMGLYVVSCELDIIYYLVDF